MAITVPALGTIASTTASASLVPGLPSGLAAGSFMLMAAGTTSIVSNWAAVTPSGWTLIAETADASRCAALWGRIWQSGDGAPTLNTSGFGNNAWARIARVEGVDLSGGTVASAVESSATINTAGANATSVSLATVTPSGNDRAIFTTCIIGDIGITTCTSPGGTTNDGKQLMNGAGTVDAVGSLDHIIQTTAAATGAQTYSWSLSTRAAAVRAVLKPAITAQNVDVGGASATFTAGGVDPRPANGFSSVQSAFSSGLPTGLVSGGGTVTVTGGKLQLDATPSYSWAVTDWPTFQYFLDRVEVEIDQAAEWDTTLSIQLNNNNRLLMGVYLNTGVPTLFAAQVVATSYVQYVEQPVTLPVRVKIEVESGLVTYKYDESPFGGWSTNMLTGHAPPAWAINGNGYMMLLAGAPVSGTGIFDNLNLPPQNVDVGGALFTAAAGGVDPTPVGPPPQNVDVGGCLFVFSAGGVDKTLGGVNVSVGGAVSTANAGGVDKSTAVLVSVGGAQMVASAGGVDKTPGGVNVSVGGASVPVFAGGVDIGAPLDPGKTTGMLDLRRRRSIWLLPTR